ncbi:hypothetical protein COCMIDRAFT_25149 [Bipolaris oryzae ATCC 44560]|uniref:ABM domain-containing protein n=1 Tax=Bipolaris oryzae ATCC 44560 TaxID=930090 RepID=W6ZAD6_COCMI|nr:uncharacterized protein COCMIDRAFT_25149 [Bipolaris oryzae ATCC 44560]EUC46950.1 hypothetical protein COCMIDRAFT_25149 [Bipolaris oryzae ATCC 44560]
MPVLEITQLRLRELSADDPALLESLSTVRAELQTGSHFYNCIDDPSVIYILGTWPSLDAHIDFLASPSKDQILGPQEKMLQFCWTVHVELGGVNLLPLDAPILAIERISVSEESTRGFGEAVHRHAQQLQGSHPFKLAHGWRCDAVPNHHEAIIFSGWQTPQAHVAFAAKNNQDGQYKTLQMTCARNLERKVVH